LKIENGNRRLSWIVCDIYLPTIYDDYKNSLIGLMGNFDDNPNNDIFDRNNNYLINIDSEREIYEFAKTCNY
jgi:hypothetical protein